MHRLAWLCLTACAAAPQPSTLVRDPCAISVSLYAWQDLPRDDERSHGLSALAWDERSGVLYAVADKTSAIQALIPDATFNHFSFGDALPVKLGGRWDVEGLAVSVDRFYLGNEAGPWVHAVARDGTDAGRVALPDSFTRARHNHGLESLALTPDGKTLIVANENSFEDDGPEADTSAGTLVRITRIDLETGKSEQQKYTTDPVFSGAGVGGIGVVDVMALSKHTLLVTERAYVVGLGNSVRTYCVDDEKPKKLVLDLATVPADGFPESGGPQRSRLLENFEGFSLGPTLPDGRRLVFAVSDDNGSQNQTPRLLVLTLSGG